VQAKHDFATMKYFLPQLGCNEVDILPGTGAGSLEVLISLFLGWGRRFLILLDDDKAGNKEKERYLEEFLLPKESVATLGDISPLLRQKKLEGLFSCDYREKVKDALELDHPPSKKEMARFHLERIAIAPLDGLPDVDAETLSRMGLIADFVKRDLGS
jgi:hypothetical protein